MDKNIHPHTAGASEGVKELLTRGVQDIIGREDLEKNLKFGKKMKIYLGADPSRPDIHLGHAVVLRKLKKFQDLGHKVIFLIGDFTAQIGDPTGKDEVRQQLSFSEIKKNAQTYKKQVSQILNFFGPNKAEIKYNSKWNKKLKFQDLIELSSNFTVQQFLERDMYQERIRAGQPISLQEFFYPLMQAYDSVVMDVDMEVGGNDQLFNMLAGRTLMQKLKKKNKIVMTFELLEGTDGRKMSKSYDNYIGITDMPNDMYGKIMSITDDLIIKYFTLCTDIVLEDIEKMAVEMKAGANPRNFKAKLAHEIVKIYHGEKKAQEAGKEFKKIFQKKDKPSNMQEISLKEDVGILETLAKYNLVSSNSDARRMIDQSAVKVNDKKIKDYNLQLKKGQKYIIQVGKRRFLQIK